MKKKSDRNNERRRYTPILDTNLTIIRSRGIYASPPNLGDPTVHPPNLGDPTVHSLGPPQNLALSRVGSKTSPWVPQSTQEGSSTPKRWVCVGWIFFILGGFRANLLGFSSLTGRSPCILQKSFPATAEF